MNTRRDIRAAASGAAAVGGGSVGPRSRGPGGLTLPALLEVGLVVGGEDLVGPGRVAPADDLGVLVLEQLVRLEEVLDLDEPVRPDLVEPFDVGLVRIGDGDAEDLEVLALLVAHLEAADRPGPDVAAGERRLVDQEEGVGVVAVAGDRVAVMKP